MSDPYPAGPPYSGQATQSNYPTQYGPAPRPAVGFVEAIKLFYSRYAKFDGRASRSEYWWAYLYQNLVSLVLAIPYFAIMMSWFAGAQAATTTAAQDAALADVPPAAVLFIILLLLWSLAHIVPGIAITVRRLHDANYSGWMYLLAFIPFGGIVVLVFLVSASKPEGARFGD